jgi:hypothetical protein
LNYVKPEKLQAVELGYKAIFAKKLLLDVNGYFNMYDNFIDQIYVYSKDSTGHKGSNYLGCKSIISGNAATSAQVWYPYTNFEQIEYILMVQVLVYLMCCLKTCSSKQAITIWIIK